MDDTVRDIRSDQKWRTRTAIVDAARQQALTGADISVAGVAKAARVSEATAYRYFPDLVSLLREVLEGTWPDPADVMKPLAGSTDVVARVAHATEFLLREVVARQGAVRAMIAASVHHPDVTSAARPGHRFGLIDSALAPLERDMLADAPVLRQLKRDLAIVVSAEALFVLTDQCGLSSDEAVASVTSTAQGIAQATVDRLRNNPPRISRVEKATSSDPATARRGGRA